MKRPWRSLKVTNGTIRYATHHFLLVAQSNNISFLHRFSDITTFLACDLEQSCFITS